MASAGGYAVENGLEFLARVSVKKLDIAFKENFIIPLSFGDVVEVFGQPGSGKSLLLLNTIAQAILPTHINGFAIGGSCLEVLLVACASTVNMMRLITIIEARIAGAMIKAPPSLTQLTCLPAIETCIKESLSRLQICECSDFNQLVATLVSLNEFFYKRTLTRLLIVEMSMLFPWPNETENGDEANKATFIRMLKAITQSYQLATLITNVEAPNSYKKKDSLRIFGSNISSHFYGRIDCSVSNDVLRLKYDNGFHHNSDHRSTRTDGQVIRDIYEPMKVTEFLNFMAR